MRGIMKGLDMPNWCYTNYAVWGGLHELEKFKSKMEVAQKYIRTNSDFGKHWLGNVLVSMRLLPLKDVRRGSIPHNLHCRGSVENAEFVIGELPEEKGGHCYLFFDTLTAWEPMDDMWKAVFAKFKTLKYVYIAEEDGCGYYVNSDSDALFFDDKYKVYYSLTGENRKILLDPERDCECCESLSESDADCWVKETFKGLSTMKDLMAFAGTFAPDNDDYLEINEFAGI